MFSLKNASCAAFIALLAGCSSIGLGTSQPYGVSQNPANQSFKLTLLGGSALNMTGDGIARPVQVCVYVVRNRDWDVPLLRKQSTCVDSASDPNVLQSKRVVLAPMHMNHISLPMESGRDAWLILDADFSQAATDHSPYIFLMSSKSSQLNVMLNGNELFLNQLAGSEPVFASPQPSPRSSSASSSQNVSSPELQRFKPLVRQSVMNPSSINMQQQGQGMLWDEISKTMDGRR
jgi:predicted component of type VI protein secretion system